MKTEELTPEEREAARRLWELFHDDKPPLIEKALLFKSTPPKVLEAVYLAIQAAGRLQNNPFQNKD